MARSRVRLDHRGLGAILRSGDMHDLVDDAIEAVADNARAAGIKVGDRNGSFMEYDLTVETFLHTTDRAHGVVALAHPAGEAVQAKHGLLTKAAAEAGLQVSGGGLLEYVTKAGVRRSATAAQVANWTRGGRP